MSFISAPMLRRVSVAALTATLTALGVAAAAPQPVITPYDRSWASAPEGTACRVGPGAAGHVVVARFKGKQWNVCAQLNPGTGRLYG
ncbi:MULTISPECIES: hypothetical protein [Rhodococcus]|uniref:hypothetical protein n=1 Tax=Rhodococcus TaxID=1827 RepID=UPI0029529DB0|nr:MULTISPECIES: hypothetical protein [Rhodococcus]MDV7246216.1 hypothetical protein [Rhodococcus oxybenzonivorans]MDV7337312.1 hypothetical protein [Rhodococcus oxybenzonivorans]MDV8031744.1 hypothetical protein [Rhodococcus sp. IEGM 27]